MAGARRLVAVCPPRERTRRAHLFATLEQSLPVRFEGRGVHELADADAVVVIGSRKAELEAAAAGLPVLSALRAEPPAVDGAAPPAVSAPRLRLAATSPMDPRLRGQLISDAGAAKATPLAVRRGDTVMAQCEDAPVWVSRGEGPARRDRVAFAPAELAPGEALRGRLQDGRALALLALLHLLREVTADIDFRPPPLRAAFLIDDPNLHWTSYGHLRYRELARHAEEHDYHVAMAMVPLDSWLAHPSATRLFREKASRLSLLFHGNDHVLQELGRPLAGERRHALLAQALRRIHSFEARTGLTVSRVMTAPHGGCSEEMARDILRLGFEGLCIGRPYPWAARPPASWLTGPHDGSPLAAFEPASVVVGGLPILLRRPFGLSSGDLALRAYLDQPLIVYGHHDDLQPGLQRFASWAEEVHSLGRVRWSSLGEIEASNFATRREGALLRVRLHSRRALLDVPEGVERLQVELPGGDGNERVALNGAAAGGLGDELAVAPQAGHVELELLRRDGVDPRGVAPPTWSPWPLARRFAGEGRDRLSPLLRRARRAGGSHSARRS
jgi:hypothetical protein